MYLEILSKLVAESLLSLYPTIVKNIDIPFGLQLWARFITYSAISWFFIDWAFISETLFTGIGTLLSVITIAHVYTSYRGFQLLDGGAAYAIFYTYPFMILIMAGEKIHYAMFLALLGIILLSFQDLGDIKTAVSKIVAEMRQPFAPVLGVNDGGADRKALSTLSYQGIAFILLAALTEAIIYFIVKRIKTKNNWNHLFLSYLLGAFVFSGVYLGDISKVAGLGGGVGLALGSNIFIGLFGYLLRFYSISRLSTAIYAPLSYFGILMAFVYGSVFNGEVVTMQKIAGALCIIAANLWTLMSKHRDQK